MRTIYKISFLVGILSIHLANVIFCYQTGVGISDITGPAAEINMMGYANPSQKTHGIHIRLFSRAYIIADDSLTNRVVFVNIDAGMVSQIVKTKVSKDLRQKFGALYTERNVLISATHSHSGPGGFHQYLLFDITSLGFVKQSFDAQVQGIVASIVSAHNNLRPGRLFINEGELLDSNINRSPTSYLANPAEERARYAYDVDKNMTVLRLTSSSGQDQLGMISWFAVHGTSMNNTNTLISGDNKGYASLLFERFKNSGSRPGKGPFVAAFAQSNEGDVSPNTAGPRCIDTGLPCDILTSTCGGRVAKCIAFGPGRDMVESTQIIGTNQFKKALDLYNSATLEITGPVSFVHQFVDMANVTVTLNASSKAHTCKPAMGFSFAAGTTDGPGAFDFRQGDIHGNPLWNIVRNLIKKPSAEQVACHQPKPILLSTGEMTFPYDWQPRIVETQILRIGQLLIVGVPGEFTTMAGRRLRDVVKQAAVAGGMPSNTQVVIAGLSNLYTDYITTFEEYQIQRYEAASTIFGPHTLRAYLEQYTRLTNALVKNTTLPAGPTPPYFVDKLYSFVPGVIYDTAGLGRNFGDVLVRPKVTYVPGEQVVVRFVSANPRNDMRQGKTFLLVEQFDVQSGQWRAVYSDGDWETKFRWFRTGFLSDIIGTSEVEISWDIPADTPTGAFRIRHFGAAKKIFSGTVEQFQGATDQFVVRRQ